MKMIGVMLTHHRVYDEYFKIDPHNPRVCELSGLPSREIHHIEARGMGGRDSMDFIENLMCLTRQWHDHFGDLTEWKGDLKEAHLWFMEHQTAFVPANPKARISREVLKFKTRLQ